MKTNKTFYQRSVDETFRAYQTDGAKGLRAEEAAKRLAQNGYNEFKKVKHTNAVQKFFAQFKSFLIIVLLIAAVISGITGWMNGEGIADALIILVIVIINAIIGAFQETKAEKSLDALEKMSAPHCKVVRDGTVQVIESRELVVGDVVVIETGDSVPADLRLIEAVNLKVQEAALTGESVPVEKDTKTITDAVPIGDRCNMVFSSCGVTYGRGKGVVVATGYDTEVGKIASMIMSVPQMQTPMQRRLDQLGKVLAIISLVICCVLFVVGLIYGNDLMTMFMTAVSLAVAAIPEGLPAVSTVVLAIGVQRLAKKNAIIRNLPSVETLGCTTVICSDKTGTLTQNKMTVTHLYSDGAVVPMGKRTTNILSLIQTAMLANDATVNLATNERAYNGDPTETALLDAGYQYGIYKESIDETCPRCMEIPFDSERKRMSTIHHVCDDSYLVAVKGGLDEVLACCTHISINGEVRPLSLLDEQEIEQANRVLADEALRVLAVAYKEIPTLPKKADVEIVENNLIFLGMVGMIDPPRLEVADAVAQCIGAGIKPVMITGDHKLTASAIARRLGILQEGELVLTGADVENMTDAELRGIVDNVSVFARVAPEHKVRIVQAYQANGNVVSMTGDGVNDAPALKLADIGVAMGITGTDVSKEAADAVLADDNFATIVSAVKEGRRIYANILKAIRFLIATNLGEIVVLFSAVIANLPLPLLPIQLLWVNLLGDSLPALALSVEPAEKDIMRQKPTDAKQGIFTRTFISQVVLQALIVGGLTLAAYFIGAQVSVDVARTMTFAVLVFSQMTLVLSIRSGHHFALRGLFSNKYLWGAILLVCGLQLCVMLIPALQTLFKVVALTSTQWWQVIGLSLAALLINEIGKVFIHWKK